MQLWPPVEEKKTRPESERRPPEKPALVKPRPPGRQSRRVDHRFQPVSDALRGHPFN
jgi:hypothetical protein